MRIRNF